jgi:DNA-directed RNA polymerase subunit RPC12/RpoP
MTYLHKFRCANCKLHFIVCSWNKEIPPVYCPECGVRDNNMHWVEETDQLIYEIVPGQSPPPGYVKQ